MRVKREEALGMDHVLVVCGAGASSTFLVHAMRREILARGAAITVDPVPLSGLESRAQNVSLVLVASHLEAQASGIRSSLPASVRVALLPALPSTGIGALLAIDLATELLAQPATAELTTFSAALPAPIIEPVLDPVPDPVLDPQGAHHG